jgi:RNA recognition motif-containing protein
MQRGRAVYAMGSPPDRPDLTRANRGSCNLHETRNHHLSKKIYVGNLPFSVTEQELRGLFESHGDIDSVNVIMDRETGRARGFAFVEMSEASSADNAIRALDGSDMGGRSLRVNEAEDKRGGGGDRR